MENSQYSIKSITQKYSIIQENTEYLTHIKRFDPRIKRLKFDCKQLNYCYNLESLEKIMVQLSYLFYTCCLMKIKIYISSNLYIEKQKDDIYQFFLEYLLDKKGFQKSTRNIEEYISKNFEQYNFTHQENSFGQIIIKQLLHYIQIRRRLGNEFKNKPQSAQNRDNYNQQKHVYQGVYNLITKYIQPIRNNIKKQKTIILCLQETLMFRKYGLLLKILKSSIYYFISQNKDVYQELKYLVNKQKQVINLKRIQGKQVASDNHKQKKLELIIDQYFVCLLKKGLIETQTTYQQNSKFGQNNNFLIGKISTLDENDKYVLCIKVGEVGWKQFNKKKLITIAQKTGENLNLYAQQDLQQKVINIEKSLYEIEYISKKNLIQIKYITNIQLSLQNTDILLYQSNQISFDLSLITLQITEKTVNKNKQSKNKEKMIAFKCVYHFHQKQQPLTKILLLIDLLMFNAKIIEPQLKKFILKPHQNWKTQQLARIQNHMSNIFFNKVKEGYKLIQNFQQ